MLRTFFTGKTISNFIYRIFLPILGILLPLLLVVINIPIAPLVTMTRMQLFELFGFCMWAVLAINAYREIKTHPGLSLKEKIVVLLPFLVSFYFLILLSEAFEPSWDYVQYENAFRLIVQGGNPYASTRYLYPPPFAEGMASLYGIGAWLFPNINSWLFVYYIHQCIQFFLTNLAYWLCIQFADRLGFPKLEGMLIVSGLFLFNYPLFRTLGLNQINLYVLNAILIAALALRSSPFLVGIAVAIGGLTKLYPFALTVPLLGMKKWKAILGVLSGVVIVVLIGRHLTLWKQFISFYLSFPVERESSLWFRNSSTLSFTRNLIRFSGLPDVLILPVFIVVASVVLGWMALRFFQREKLFQTLESGIVADVYRNFGHLTDFSVLTLLLAPSAWDHHFVIALPLALWAIALQGHVKPMQVGFGVVSIFVLPGFNIFPLSYLRLFGVILLLLVTPPTVLFDSTTVAKAWRGDLVADEGTRLS